MNKTRKFPIHKNSFLKKAISAIAAVAFFAFCLPDVSWALRAVAYGERASYSRAKVEEVITKLQILPPDADAPDALWDELRNIFPQLNRFVDSEGRSDHNQMQHARRVVNSLHRILNHEPSLAPIYANLSPQDKKLLWLAVILHDVGRIKGLNMHHINGAIETEDILPKLGYDEGAARFLSKLIRMHTFLGMLLTGEKTPLAVIEVADSVSENPVIQDRFLSLLVLLTASDIKGYAPDRDILTRDKIELLAKCKSIADIRALSDGFWLYRLRQMAKSDKNSPLDEREEAIFRNIEQYLEMALDGDGARIKRLKQALNQGIETIHHMQFSLPLLLRLKTDEQDTDEKAAIRFIRLCDFFAAQHEQGGITLVTAELYGNRQLTQEEKGFAQQGLAAALSGERDMRLLITVRGEKLILDIDSLTKMPSQRTERLLKEGVHQLAEAQI